MDLFVGIDIGKLSHVAGFLSGDLLAQHKRFEQCPTLAFPQSRAGLETLLARIRSYGEDLSRVSVLIEHTGHYHRTLEEGLHQAGLSVYVIAVHARRANGLDKTDKTDALRLANLLYAQIGLGMQVSEVASRVQRRLPPTPAALRLRGLVGRRHELMERQVAVRNKLTAICDELFPEMRQVFRDVNGEICRLLRERWPTSAKLAEASLEELRQVRRRNHTPSDARLTELQRLATISLGIREAGRVHGLVTEQRQLLEELRLTGRHLEELEAEIREVCERDRAGQILLSVPSVGLIAAATLLGSIGTVDNFARASFLRKFCGWAPQAFQTGTSLDSVIQTKTGARLLRQTLFMVVISSLTHENEWSHLYQRLVPLKCRYDPRTKAHIGKMRVVGRVAGQIVGVIWTLLTNDARVCREYAARGEAPPPPVLYDPEVHRKHREAGAKRVVE